MSSDGRGKPEIARRIRVIDSHTGGEPTRVVVENGPDLGGGDVRSQMAVLRERFDDFRTAVVGEPRGSDALVGALICPPADPSCACGVVFFNNVGYLGMCVHGTIGLVVTLAHLGRIGSGQVRIETPVGVVTATLTDGHRVSVRNVESFRTGQDVRVEVPDYGPVIGDVAWGGNWFFLVRDTPEAIDLANVDRLTDICWRIRQALAQQGITGTGGAEIDHIELFGPPTDASADSKNFVLCPGKAYDRSPCGTGTSAKLACLVADGKLLPGQTWRQEGITGSVFVGVAAVEPLPSATTAPPPPAAANDQSAVEQFAAAPHAAVRLQAITPHIAGTAHVNAEAMLLLDPRDPLRLGLRR